MHDRFGVPPIHQNRRPERWAPLTALFGGVVALVLWVYAVRYAMPRSGRTLERAKEIGLVSWTTLSGYDTAQEANAWLLGCIVVPLGLWAGWLALGGAKASPGAPTTPEDTSRTDQRLNPVAGSPLWPPPAWVPWLAMLTVVLSVVLRLDIARNPNPWGSFGLLGEEGVACVRDLRVRRPTADPLQDRLGVRGHRNHVVQRPSRSVCVSLPCSSECGAFSVEVCIRGDAREATAGPGRRFPESCVRGLYTVGSFRCYFGCSG